MAGPCAALLKLGAVRPPNDLFEPSMSVLLTQTPELAHADARRVMGELLDLRHMDEKNGWTIMEKGLPPRRLALPFLAGLFTIIIGALLAVLFAFEGTITLKSGSPAAFTPEDRGILRPFWAGAGESDIRLLFEGSESEYVETVATEEAFRPVEVKARLKVTRDGSALEGLAGTREPFKYGGFAFSLMELEQTLRLRIDDSPIPINARPGAEALIPGSLSTLLFGQFRNGVVAKIDGSREELKPHITVRKKGTSGEPATLRPGEPVIVDGALVSLADVRETAVIRYSYDPGRAVLLAGGLITVLTIMLKLCWPYYFLAYRIDDSGEIVRLDLFASTGGAFASREKLLNRIVRLLTKDDLRLEALPD
ncbi:MAG: hypothetical protein H3C68_01905 [Deltaproteobacteria bacterium]|nr:hypothetical protein [Deltaproteobacteria bacterium]MBZ0218991.1 hypothetical protein [Deltaproteobacteria bacterium]